VGAFVLALPRSSAPFRLWCWTALVVIGPRRLSWLRRDVLMACSRTHMRCNQYHNGQGKQPNGGTIHNSPRPRLIGDVFAANEGGDTKSIYAWLQGKNGVTDGVAPPLSHNTGIYHARLDITTTSLLSASRSY
jgi:hypothetical protein